MGLMKAAGLAVAALAILVLVSGCGGDPENTLMLGATTSVADPGLLDDLVSAFEEESGYHVVPVVGGSGDILERARRGELDVIITHSPSDEQKLVDDGEGLEPRKVMENFFVIAGPADDPAGVARTTTLADAFEAIVTADAPFISRGDNSGTHKRELATWDGIGIDPNGHDWYQESAVGQGQNVLVASEKGAYTLVDSSTFISVRDKVALQALLTDEDTPNVYTVMLVNPEEHDRVNVEAARAWADFVTGAAGQATIAGFGKGEYGEALFVPLANSVSGAPSR